MSVDRLVARFRVSDAVCYVFQTHERFERTLFVIFC